MDKTKNHCVYLSKHKTNKHKIDYVGQRNKPNAARVHKIGGQPSENFHTVILHSHLTQKEANKFEKFEIKERGCVVPNGFNRTYGGKTEQKCLPPSAEHRAKLSKANTSKKLSVETRAKISKANTGKKLSTKHRKKLSKALTGIKRSSKSSQKNWKTRRKNKTDKHSLKSKKLISKNSAMHNPKIAMKRTLSQLNITLEKWKTLNKLESRKCACGCNKTFECKNKSNKKFISGHNGKGSNNGKWVPREIRSCACGCKQTFECLMNSVKKFIHGHNSVGNPNAQRAILIRWGRIT